MSYRQTTFLACICKVLVMCLGERDLTLAHRPPLPVSYNKYMGIGVYGNSYTSYRRISVSLRSNAPGFYLQSILYETQTV